MDGLTGVAAATVVPLLPLGGAAGDYARHLIAAFVLDVRGARVSDPATMVVREGSATIDMAGV